MRTSSPRRILLILLTFGALLAPLFADAAGGGGGHGGEHQLRIPLEEFQAHEEGMGVFEKLAHRAGKDPFNVVATLIFVLAIAHTFMAGTFLKWAHAAEHEHQERIRKEGRTAESKPFENSEDDVSFKATLFHFLGEVEAIFGIWLIPLIGAILFFKGGEWGYVTEYIGHDVNYTEPMFVIVIMAIAATRPVIRFSEKTIGLVANAAGGSPAAWWFSLLTVGPVLGSFITEPAAMTITALLLSRRFYDHKPSLKFAYATIGLLFVNISVGGTLSNFAAPPVLMVAAPWDWSLPFMITHFGWKAVVGILISNTLYFLYFRKEFARLTPHTGSEDSPSTPWKDRDTPIPIWITVAHIFFLGWTVLNAHYPPLFWGGFLFFIAFTMATSHHQNRIQLKSPLLVGFFLAGLVTHGGLQQWWIEPVLSSLGELPLMVGATVLTAFNDNAAITYLATLVPSFDPGMKYAVVAGAVTGGGLTVIANAPNPAGQSILSRYFPGGVSPLFLAASAAIPTVILGVCYMAIPPTSYEEADLPEEAPFIMHADDPHATMGPGASESH